MTPAHRQLRKAWQDSLLTMCQVAERSGVGRNTVAGVLYSKRNTSVEVFEKIVKAMGKKIEIVDN